MAVGSIYEKPFDEIVEADLQTLVDQRATEDWRLEFKQEVDFDRPESKEKLKEGVTSFGNTAPPGPV